jgi:hypothetical protein
MSYRKSASTTMRTDCDYCLLRQKIRVTLNQEDRFTDNAKRYSASRSVIPHETIEINSVVSLVVYVCEPLQSPAAEGLVISVSVIDNTIATNRKTSHSWKSDGV